MTCDALSTRAGGTGPVAPGISAIVWTQDIVVMSDESTGREAADAVVEWQIASTLLSEGDDLAMVSRPRRVASSASAADADVSDETPLFVMRCTASSAEQADWIMSR